MSTLLIKPIKKTGHKGLGWSKMLKNGPHTWFVYGPLFN